MNKKTAKGFTLIELLIVIALLGALAVGLLAAVDPFEQLKKGRDTSLRNTAAEFFNATIRYYAQRSEFPWDTSVVGIGGTSSLDTMGSSITTMANAGELKQDFYTLAGGSSNLKKVNLYFENTEKIVICFQPESKSFRNDKNTIYDSTGSILSSCPDATSNACHICFK
ncbi:type II secretion system protein [Candidatus Roizmanbacteria bacterium]|jgi:prepilin-type N-terminal cleavage/methylation domain-containing protein|nr:type II secretion system protein [Candidatus Roizmanbacteria bacterium]